MAHTDNSSTLEVEAGGSGAESQHWLLSEFKANLGYTAHEIYIEGGGRDGLVGKSACCTIMST